LAGSPFTSAAFSQSKSAVHFFNHPKRFGTLLGIDLGSVHAHTFLSSAIHYRLERHSVTGREFNFTGNIGDVVIKFRLARIRQWHDKAEAALVKINSDYSEHDDSPRFARSRNSVTACRTIAPADVLRALPSALAAAHARGSMNSAVS
jgi:hypothetical protein